MQPDPQALAEFRSLVQQARNARPEAWEASRRLVAASHLTATLTRLQETIGRARLAPPLQDALLTSLHSGLANRVQDLPGQALKDLTGLPPSKAVRALCVYFGLTADSSADAEALQPAADAIEGFLRSHANPYDLLLEVEAPSFLDVGAGDASLAEELIAGYLPRLQTHQKTLVVHCVDRVRPGSRFGAAFQPDPALLSRLRHSPPPGLAFQYWGDQDMFALNQLTGLRPRYTIATCQAPASPTFAYEPSRLSRAEIDNHLRRTKGTFRLVREDGEEALEVLHGGRALLFPPWKFDIRGPLVLLDLLSRKGALVILGAVDDEVFWEILTQLVADPGARPRDVILDASRLPALLGKLYEQLTRLPIGESLRLGDVTALRPSLPRVLKSRDAGREPYRFRYVDIRRGATFPNIPNMPASRTARRFTDMPEEVPPWMLVLVPDRSA
ncbi:MAG: hypothetical protein ACREI3_10605 [Nitrospirales bacterium]